MKDYCLFSKISRAIETCNPDTLRHLASVYHDLLSHEKPIDFLIELLQKDQIHDAISLNTLDKTITFYQVICFPIDQIKFVKLLCFSMFTKAI